MYNAFAKFYDTFMADIDYEAWADYIAGFLGDRTSGIDFACGTGMLTLGLQRRGYQVFGVDQSLEMLNVARIRAQSVGSRVEFLQGSLESFCPQRPVEFVTVVCDGLNYVRNLTGAIQNLCACLFENGILIFDISTEYKLKNVIGNGTFFDETENAAYVWRNRLSEKKRCIEMDLTFFEREGERYRRFDESQIQYIHTEQEVMSALGDAGFASIRRFGGFSKRVPRTDSERIHFIAIK